MCTPSDNSYKTYELISPKHSVASTWETEPGNPLYEVQLDYKVKLHLRGTKIGMQLGGRAPTRLTQALPWAHMLAL